MECKNCGSRNISLLECSKPKHTKLKWKLFIGIWISFTLSAVWKYFTILSALLLIVLIAVNKIDKRNKHITCTKYICMDCDFEEYL